MKKNHFLTILLATALLFAGYNANAQGRIELGRSAENSVKLHSSSMAGFTSTFSFNSIESELIANEKGEFSEIYIDGSFPYGEVGSPELPMITRLIVIPDGATPMVKVSGYSESEYKLADYGIGKLAAMQAPIRKSVDPRTVEYAVNKAAYARDSYNNDEIATVEYLGTMRGISIGKLTVCPVRYNPVAGTVKVYNDIEVKVGFQNANEASTRSMFAATYSPAFNSVYDQLFNIDMLMGGSGKDAYTDHPDLYNTPVKMLVICYSEFKNNSKLNEWLQWKLQKGYYVDIFYTDETGTSATNIKNFIKTKYNASVSAGNAYTYLIIIGDTGQVPQYMTKTIDSDIGECASDLGYSSVNFTTSSTTNYFPDMYYSRISVENTTHLTNYINKVLTYERYEFTDGGDYLNNVILVAGWDDYGHTSSIGKPTINYGKNNYFNTSNTTYGGFGNGTISTTISTSLTSGWSGSNNGCYNGLNNGVCLINYTAHGDKQEWSQPKISAKQVESFSNTGKYFLGIGNCCLTGNFNLASSSYSSSNAPSSAIGATACFAETMIRVPNAGAVAYIGCSPYSYWYEDFYWAVGAHSYSSGNAPSVSGSSMGVYDAMFTDQYWNSASSLLYVGNLAVQQAVTNNNSNSEISGSGEGGDCSNSAHYYFQFYHTFGDGSVMPYITKPETNNVTIPSTIEPNATSMTVNAVAGSYVAVTNNTNTIYGVGVANTSGVATVNFTNTIPSSGNLHVVVTRQQYQPYFGTVEVRSSSSISVTATATPSIIARGSSSTLKATATGGTNYTYIWTPSATLNNANIQQPTATPTQTTTYTVTVSSNGDSNTANVTVQVVTPPTNLTATAVGCGSGVKLTWTAPSLATSYKIYRNNALIASNVTDTEYTDSNLSAGTYSYQVAAVYQSVESKSTAVSQTLEGASGPCECEVVFSLRDSYGDGWNGSTLTVSFSDGTTAQTLDFPKSSNYSSWNKCDTLKIYTLTINQGTNVSVVFNSGSSYDNECYLNIAYDGGEVIYNCNAGDLTNSDGQTIATFQTNCGGGTVVENCYAPTNLNATAGTSSISLTWTASSTASSYRVYRNGSQIANNVTGTSYTDNTAVTGTSYTYTVKANCTNGDLSDASNSASATISGGSSSGEDVCYELVLPTAAGDYVMGYLSGTTITMPTHNNGTAATTSVTVTTTNEGFSVNENNTPIKLTLTSTGTSGEYYISYNGRRLQRATGTGSTAVTWASSSTTTRTAWTINEDGITQKPLVTTYYLYYNNGFYTSTTSNNNINFYVQGECGGSSCTNVTHEFSVETCDDSYTWNGHTYNTSGNYVQSFPIGGDTPTPGIVGDEFFYDFDTHPDLDNDDEMEGWQFFTISTDEGDTLSWEFYSGIGYNDSESCIGSQSSHKVNGSWVDITPDHWIVLPSAYIGSTSTLSLYARGYSSGNYASEHFGVFVTTNANFEYVSDFTLMGDWTTTNDWTPYSVDLSEYAGQNLLIAIRHYDCYGQCYLFVDDIRLSNGNAKTVLQPMASTEAIGERPSVNFTSKSFSTSTRHIIADKIVRHTEPTRGCDSIVTLHLTLNPNYEGLTDSETICPNEPFTWHGHTFNGAGSYTANLQTVHGCDSIVTMTVNVYASEDQDIFLSSCTPYPWHGTTYYTSGDYVYDGITTNGCPVHEELHLTIETPEVTITGDESIELGSAVTLTASGAETYVWNNGETTASINVSPGETTTYSVIGTDANGCTGTAEFTVNVDGIGETASTVSIFPNPVKHVVSVRANNIERVRVFDLTGQLLLETNENGNQVHIDMNGYSAGHYFMQVTTQSGIVTEKVIKR